MMKNGNSFTVMQLNDSHAYFDLHQEMFWLGGQAVYRPAGGYARIATLVKLIRAGNQERVLFCDCGDTLHGTYPVLKTQGQALIPVLNSLGLDAMTAHWEFAYGPATFKQRAAELSYSCGQGPCSGEERCSVDEGDARAACAARQGQSEAHIRDQDALGHQASKRSGH